MVDCWWILDYWQPTCDSIPLRAYGTISSEHPSIQMFHNSSIVCLVRYNLIICLHMRASLTLPLIIMCQPWTVARHMYKCTAVKGSKGEGREYIWVSLKWFSVHHIRSLTLSLSLYVQVYMYLSVWSSTLETKLFNFISALIEIFTFMTVINTNRLKQRCRKWIS